MVCNKLLSEYLDAPVRSLRDEVSPPSVLLDAFFREEVLSPDLVRRTPRTLSLDFVLLGFVLRGDFPRCCCGMMVRESVLSSSRLLPFARFPSFFEDVIGTRLMQTIFHDNNLLEAQLNNRFAVTKQKREIVYLQEIRTKNMYRCKLIMKID